MCHVLRIFHLHYDNFEFWFLCFLEHKREKNLSKASSSCEADCCQLVKEGYILLTLNVHNNVHEHTTSVYPLPQQSTPHPCIHGLTISSRTDIRGIVHYEFVPTGQTVNQLYYLEVLKRLCEKVRRK